MPDETPPPSDPRSVSSGSDRWITDTRIYNVVWLGRWLERSENICRALDTAALASIGSPNDAFGANLSRISSAWGLAAQGTSKALDDLVWSSPSSSILTCLQKARENASQVAPLELIQSINTTIHDLEQRRIGGSSLTPESLHELVTRVLADLKEAFGIIEQTWFRREALGEEEIMRRFVQQQ